MPVGVRLPYENRTWSLTPVSIRVPTSDEDCTWSLTPTIVRVPDLGEDRHRLSCLLVFVFKLSARTDMVSHARWCLLLSGKLNQIRIGIRKDEPDR